jgi:hypothetical protein
MPNISSSNSIIQKIKELDQQRFKLDAQITSGQKLTLPEGRWDAFGACNPNGDSKGATNAIPEKCFLC